MTLSVTARAQRFRKACVPVRLETTWGMFFSASSKKGFACLSYKGVFLADFERCHQSLIGLFNGADASTLPHESAHWLKAAMEDLIGAGVTCFAVLRRHIRIDECILSRLIFDENAL